MGPLAARLAALALGLLAGGAVVLWLRPRAEELEFMEPDLEALERGTEGPASSGSTGLVRRPLDEETVRALMPLQGRVRVYDPHCYFRYDGDVRTRMGFREHPDGGYWRRTNSLGLRMDDELRPDAEPLVVLAGDSHLDGVCNNAEGLPALLEQSLRDALPGIQVANTGCGAYTFYHYLGVLERLLALDRVPELFVVVVFGGNDLGALPLLARVFEGLPRRGWPAEQAQLRREVRPAPLGQGILAVEHFHLFPDDVDLALRVARQATTEMREVCRSVGTRLLVVYLPAPLELPDQAPLKESWSVLERFGRPREAAGILGRMADDYLRDLEEEGIAFLDLREGFRAAPEQLYWRTDLHLSLAGHRRAAELLAPRVRELLAGPSDDR